MRTILLLAASMLAFADSGHADIYQWEYIDPADPSKGKQQSVTLVPDGAGVDAVSGAHLSHHNLTMAYLAGANLTHAYAPFTNLTSADLSHANVTSADFEGATLTGADFAGAEIHDVNFSKYNDIQYGLYGTGISTEQLHSTASYQKHDLKGINFSYNNLVGANFANQNLLGTYFMGATLSGANFSGQDLSGKAFGDADLTAASFRQANLAHASFATLDSCYNCVGGPFYTFATLTDADLTSADIRGARFGTLTLAQIYSTASYQARDLSSVSFQSGEYIDGDFTEQDLTNANFSPSPRSLSRVNLERARFSRAILTGASFIGATLIDADFTDANIHGAKFDLGIGYDFIFGSGGFYSFGTGISPTQVYSTASYQSRNLSGVGLKLNDLTGANFANQNLNNASLLGSTLTDADFSNAEIRGASLGRFVRRKSPTTWQLYILGTGISSFQLQSTASYRARDLRGIDFSYSELSGFDFVGQDVSNSSFHGANLAGANFKGAVVRGTSFDTSDRTGDSGLCQNPFTCQPFGTGITLDQLYATASYQTHDLQEINLARNSLANGEFVDQDFTNASFFRAILTGANFRGANLTNTNFSQAILTSADLSAADVRGANLHPSDAAANNLIRPDGHIYGLYLDVNDRLVVRDYDGHPLATQPTLIPITVDQHMSMGPGGTLRMVFEADAWDSTISFEPGIPVTLGGTLEFTFADEVNLASQVGRTLMIFDWTGVSPTGAFSVASPYAWDVSRLYSTGEVTLTAVPEPDTFHLISLAITTLFAVSHFRNPSVFGIGKENQ